MSGSGSNSVENPRRVGDESLAISIGRNAMRKRNKRFSRMMSQLAQTVENMAANTQHFAEANAAMRQLLMQQGQSIPPLREDMGENQVEESVQMHQVSHNSR
ncbi:Uncharacterized protein Fot_35064 [Forsythia ovata]|uniref:Uncharacterized protein n=1 Tax=Forsythia ovata TaxID=205694 RepID=A0ABD1SKG0_9LAMI